MILKGIKGIEPLGFISVDELCDYFYFHLPDDSLIELEVVLDMDARQYSRKVTAFITDRDQVAELLGV